MLVYQHRIISALQEKFVCEKAINHVIAKACLNSSCTSTNGTVDMFWSEESDGYIH